MITIRTGRIAAAAAAATFLLAAAAPAADTPGAPRSSITASISPNRVSRGRGGIGTAVRLKLGITFDHPADSRIRLTRVVLQFPQGATTNGKFFKSCTADALNRARGSLKVCPRGSKIGSGRAVGTAADIGVTSSGKLTLFNGPGGKSITLNVSILNPALINLTFSAPIKRTSGRYGTKLTFTIPTGLQTILDGPIVVRRIDTTTFATTMVNGVKRGYIEAWKCPRNRKAPLHGDFTFSDGLSGSADTTVACR